MSHTANEERMPPFRRNSSAPPAKEFTSQEVFHLRIGTRKFGLNYERILQSYRFSSGRTAKELASKWAELVGCKSSPMNTTLPFKTTRTGASPAEAALPFVTNRQQDKVGSILRGKVQTVPAASNSSTNHENGGSSRKRTLRLSPKGLHPNDFVVRKRIEMVVPSIPSFIAELMEDEDDINKFYDEGVSDIGDIASSSGQVAFTPAAVHTKPTEKRQKDPLPRRVLPRPQFEELTATPSAQELEQHRQFSGAIILDDTFREMRSYQTAVNFVDSSSDTQSSDSTSTDDELEAARIHHRDAWIQSSLRMHLEQLRQVTTMSQENAWQLLAHMISLPIRKVARGAINLVYDLLERKGTTQQVILWNGNGVAQSQVWKVMITEINDATSEQDLENVVSVFRCASILAVQGKSKITVAFDDDVAEAVRFVLATWTRWYEVARRRDGQARELLAFLVRIVQVDESLRTCVLENDSTPPSLCTAIRIRRRTGPVSSRRVI